MLTALTSGATLAAISARVSVDSLEMVKGVGVSKHKQF